MAYYIEIISIGIDNYQQLEGVANLLNSVQSEFIFKTPPDRLKKDGLGYTLKEYKTTEVLEWLMKYRKHARGERSYLIGIIPGHLTSSKYSNLFGTHVAEEGLAVISLYQIFRFIKSAEAYLAYYFVRYALSFVNPKWKNHEETRGCYFDRKIKKRDLRLSLLSNGLLCDECSRNFQEYFNPEISQAFKKMAELVTALENQDKELVAKLTGAAKVLPTVVILTAIKEEHAATIAHLSELSEANVDDTFYDCGFFDLEGKRIARVIVRECGPKNTNASQETERAVNAFKPDMMMFVGIAGSRKPKDFRIGDVIFPSKVYFYEGGKATNDGLLARPESIAPTYLLSELAKRERLKKDWLKLIKIDYPDSVKADIGIIASGEQLIENHDSEVGKLIYEHFNDSSAVEMEGFGFMSAMSRQGRNNGKTVYGVVRGISDIMVEGDSNTISLQEDNTDRRPGNVKELASGTAAAFAFWLIFKTFGRANSDR